MRPSRLLLSILLSFAATMPVHAYYPADGVNQEEQQGKQPQAEKKLDYAKLYKESMEWFPADTPPILKEFLKNPDDPILADLVVKYLDKRTDLAVRAADVTQRIRDGNSANVNAMPALSADEALLSELRAMGVAGYSVMYFYSSTCPHCIKSEPLIKSVAAFMPVKKIEATQNNYQLFIQWKVDQTPTTFFKKGDAAYKMVGELTLESLAGFLQLIRQ